MDSKRDAEQENINTNTDKISLAAECQGVSRRKFTRNALVGSAVLLTLSNRSAWGETATACISTSLLTSYAQAQASRPFNLEQQAEIQRYENHTLVLSSDDDKTCYEYDTNATNNGIIQIIDSRATPPAK